jgi:hypothetical protein
MAQKLVKIDNLGIIALVRRRGAKHIRLSFNSHGQLRVTLPYFLPYSVGISFAKSKQAWVKKHQPETPAKLYANNQKIGKYHTLACSEQPLKNKKPVHIKDNVIHFHGELDDSLHSLLEKAINKCLKDEAVELLPSRLNKLADKHGYSYTDVKIKKMHSRWGSCSNLKVIVLSYYLVQLPWELIDYVLLHELVHTMHMDHSPKFWGTLADELPNLKYLRRQIKSYRPAILTT